MRLGVWGIALAATLVFGGPAPAQAQGYPARPVRLVIQFPPGGASDILARSAAVPRLTPQPEDSIHVPYKGTPPALVDLLSIR